MLPKRVRISKGATETLKLLKARTGLTPNITCRIALILSLENGPRGGEREVDQTGSEFNAPTLYGEFGNLFDCLIREVHGALDTKAIGVVIASHIDNGLDSLRKTKNILELVEYSGLAA
jgi:DNA sulfur modification protein DndE